TLPKLPTWMVKYYKDKIGSSNPSTKEFLKSEQFKYFFPEKGKYKELFRRHKEFIAEREQILTEFKGQKIKRNFYLHTESSIYQGNSTKR
ncbi:17537_t:CDS:1, partial [Gigaspora rosea]